MKLTNDKYYTPPDLARELIVKTIRFIGAKNITDIIEPSAGNGSFSKWFKNCRAYDIEPEAEGIIKQDFLTLDLPYQKGRLIIGNPPFGCYVPDTEILTKEGWKYIKDVTEKDVCLSINIESLNIEWSKITSTLKKEVDEPLLYFKSNNIDLKVTKDHRMFAYNKFKSNPYSLKDVTAEELPYSRCCIPKRGYSWTGYSDTFFKLPSCELEYLNRIEIKPELYINMKDWVKFFGLWLADGCCRRTLNSQGNPRFCVSIKQHKNGFNMVKSILDSLPFTYKIYENKGRNSYNFDINSKQLWLYLEKYGVSATKYVPDYIKEGTTEVLKSFMEGYTNGDSKKIKNHENSFICNSVSKQLIEDIQEICLKLGWLSNISKSNEKYKYKGIEKPFHRYSTTYYPNGTFKDNSIYYPKPIKEHYKGLVYCIELDKNGYLFIRRNNKISISGNCSNHLSRKFYKKATELGDYIAFIQPISQYKNNLQMYLFDLVYSEDLGVVKYSDRELHCCFNIYKRPENGILNEQPDYTLKDITIIEHRRKKGNYQTAKNKDISPDYDYAMCNWGDGSLGRPCKYIGQYAQEVYFYCHKKEFLPKMLELLEFNTIREYVKSISMKRISVMRLYKYLRDNIEGIR